VAQHWGPLLRLDHRIALALNDYVAPRPAQAHAWRVLSAVFAPAVLRGVLVVAAVVLLLYRRLVPALLCAGVALGSLLIVTVGKIAVDRPRPHVPHPVASAPGASFPSGHALTSAAVALTLVALLWPRASRRWRVVTGVVAGAVAVLVGFSRMILGVHFLSDVVGGWFGAVVLVFGILAVLPLDGPRRD